MNTRSILGAAALASTVVLTASACGGGGSTLSRADLVSKTNALCKSVNTQIDAVPQPSDVTDATQATAYFDKILPIVTKAQNTINGYKPDDAVKADWNAFVAAQQKSTNLLKSVDAKTHAKDPSGLTDLQSQGQTIDDGVNAAATKLGATECADSSSGSGN